MSCKKLVSRELACCFYRWKEKLKIVKLTEDQEKSLRNVVNQLADTSVWPLEYLDYQYKVC